MIFKYLYTRLFAFEIIFYRECFIERGIVKGNVPRKGERDLNDGTLRNCMTLPTIILQLSINQTSLVQKKRSYRESNSEQAVYP